MSVKHVDVWETPTPAGLDAPQPRPSGEDLFRSMSPEELAQYPGPSEEDLQEAIERGRRDRQRAVKPGGGYRPRGT